MNVVISQPMYFPWIGFLEQLQIANVFVLYDDVQFSKGSFTNRVQIKTHAGPRWLTVPLRGLRLGQLINEVQINDQIDWRRQHRETLFQAYKNCAFVRDMIDLVDTVFSQPVETLSELSNASTFALAEYFNVGTSLSRYVAADMKIAGGGSQRVLDIVRFLGGKAYITGHGARNYLDHCAFEQAGITVRYMDYRCLPYQQQHGDFTPYVSALDLVANCGRDGINYIQSTSIDWRDFIDEL